jgi:hypothetical protein
LQMKLRRKMNKMKKRKKIFMKSKEIYQILLQNPFKMTTKNKDQALLNKVWLKEHKNIVIRMMPHLW